MRRPVPSRADRPGLPSLPLALPTHHGRWGVAWYLWDAMQLGPFDEFKAFSKGYLTPETHEAVSLAALPKRSMCETPKDYSVEQIKALHCVGGVTEDLG